MPLFFLIIAAAIAIFGIVIYKARSGKEASDMKSKIINGSIFMISFISFIISLKLFWNMGVYADEYGSSPTLVCGGFFWLCMDWLRLGLLFALCLISGFHACRRLK